eukprot:Nitzschia sp. Nitz4//scaffold252_size28738//20236//20868//NITZ4_008099-RA/size28738-processed-gene-0.7-mRNA-1//1//CDS//3329544275//8584//frame0
MSAGKQGLEQTPLPLPAAIEVIVEEEPEADYRDLAPVTGLSSPVDHGTRTSHDPSASPHRVSQATDPPPAPPQVEDNISELTWHSQRYPEMDRLFMKHVLVRTETKIPYSTKEKDGHRRHGFRIQRNRCFRCPKNAAKRTPYYCPACLPPPKCHRLWLCHACFAAHLGEVEEQLQAEFLYTGKPYSSKPAKVSRKGVMHFNFSIPSQSAS